MVVGDEANLDCLCSETLMSISQNFLEGLILLALTASLSGFLVPYLLKQIDERKLRNQKFIDERRLREQKEFDADLARQNKIIDAQVQVLDTLTQLLWEFQLLALSVTYYKLNNEEKYEIAFKEYDEKAWMYFGKIRSEISKTVRLASNDVYQALLDFYVNCLFTSDSKLVTLVRKKDAPREEWSTRHNFLLQSLSNENDRIISLLAKEFKLSSRTNLPNKSVGADLQQRTVL